MSAIRRGERTGILHRVGIDEENLVGILDGVEPVSDDNLGG